MKLSTKIMESKWQQHTVVTTNHHFLFSTEASHSPGQFPTHTNNSGDHGDRSIPPRNGKW